MLGGGSTELSMYQTQPDAESSLSIVWKTLFYQDSNSLLEGLGCQVKGIHDMSSTNVTSLSLIQEFIGLLWGRQEWWHL